jgi:hypothetical protein
MIQRGDNAGSDVAQYFETVMRLRGMRQELQCTTTTVDLTVLGFVGFHRPRKRRLLGAFIAHASAGGS